MTSGKAELRKAVKARLRRQYHRWLVRQPSYQAVRRNWIRKHWRKQTRRARRLRRYLLPLVWGVLGLGLLAFIAIVLTALDQSFPLTTPTARARIPIEWQGEFSRGLSVACLSGVLIALTLAARVPSREVVTPRVLKWLYHVVTSLLAGGLLLAQIKSGADNVGLALLAFCVSVVGSSLIVLTFCHFVVEFTRLGIQPVWGEGTPLSGMTWKDALFFIPAVPILILISLQRRGPDWLFPLSSFSQRIAEISNGSLAALPNLLALFAALGALNVFFRWRHGPFAFRRSLIETTREAEVPLPSLAHGKGHEEAVNSFKAGSIDPCEMEFQSELDKLRSPTILHRMIGGYWNVRFAKTKNVVLVTTFALFVHMLIAATEFGLGLFQDGRLFWMLSAMVVMGHAIGMIILQCFDEASGIGVESCGLMRPLSWQQRAREKAKELPVMLGLVMLVSGLPHFVLSLRYGVDWQQDVAFLLTVASWIITASITQLGILYALNARSLYTWRVRLVLDALLWMTPIALIAVVVFGLAALGMIQSGAEGQGHWPWGLEDTWFPSGWLLTCWASGLAVAVGYCVGMYVIFHHERGFRWSRHLTE